MTKTAALIALAVLAAGCTTFDLGTRFRKPNATISRSSLDEWECHRDIKDPETIGFVGGGPIDAVRVIVESVERQRQIVDCMRSRGYEPVRAMAPQTPVRTALACR